MTWRKKIGIFPWHHIPKLCLLKSGAPFFEELFACIHHARKSIYIQVYIFEKDTTGTRVYDALLQACKRGVQVYLHLDAYGSANFPLSWVNELKKAGAEVNFFSPFKLAFRYHLGMRLHHKIFIFDAHKALMGGINISDHYSHLGKPECWLDFGIMLEGNAVTDLLKICKSINQGLLPKSILRVEPKTGYAPEQGFYKVRILQNHWVKAKFGISRQYRQQIRKAHKEIVLVSSYFLPSPALKRLLKKAAQRGVRVQLVLGGKTDVPMMFYAAQFFYRDLLKAGVEIWEWQPSVLHAKMAFTDNDWMCIGSYNLNHLSDFGSVECNIEIRDKEFHDAALQELQALLDKDALLVNPLQYDHKIGLFKQIRNFISYRLISFSLKILFYLQRNK